MPTYSSMWNPITLDHGTSSRLVSASRNANCEFPLANITFARKAESLGYDHLWVYDHVETVPRREPTHVFEAWTVMAALAEFTSTPMLGQLVTCTSYRNAGLLAKQAACIDVMSGGRLIFGIGAGWYHEEYAAYGWPFLSGGERLKAMDKTMSD